MWLSASVRHAGWAPALVVLLHFLVFRPLSTHALVRSLNSYEHFLGGMAFAFFFSRSLAIPEARALGALSPFGRLLLTLTTVCTAALAWEFIEWITDRLGWTYAQLSLTDTLVDLGVGVLGGVVFLLLAGLFAVSGMRGAPNGPSEPAPQ